MLLDLLKHVSQIGSQVPARVKTSKTAVEGLFMSKRVILSARQILPVFT